MSSENTKGRKVLKTIKNSLIVVVLVVILTNFFSYKNRISRIVRGNTDLLNQSVQSASYDDAYKIKGIKDISRYTNPDGSLLIDYYCYGFGIVPSSVYSGFYYSGNGKPAGFQGVNYELIKEGNEWTWSEKDGDNWYYTEQILDNWYYYKAGF
jgi:hypothetical protein